MQNAAYEKPETTQRTIFKNKKTGKHETFYCFPIGSKAFIIYVETVERVKKAEKSNKLSVNCIKNVNENKMKIPVQIFTLVDDERYTKT